MMKISSRTVAIRSEINWLAKFSLRFFVVFSVIYLLLVPFIPEFKTFVESTGFKFFTLTWFLLLFICKLEHRNPGMGDVDWVKVGCFFILYFLIF